MPTLAIRLGFASAIFWGLMDAPWLHPVNVPDATRQATTLLVLQDSARMATTGLALGLASAFLVARIEAAKRQAYSALARWTHSL